MYTYEELNEKSMKELSELKNAELERIAEGEKKRQALIRSILLYQTKFDLSDRFVDNKDVHKE